MSDTLNYFGAKTATEAAMQAYNYAGQKLENAKIKERLAETKSQHEPLSKIITAFFPDLKNDDVRKMRAAMHAASFYVVVGRIPEKTDEQP